MSIDVSQYKVGVILSLQDCGRCKTGKTLQACKIRIGGIDDNDYDEDNDIITVVTSAPNVRDGSRVAVAPAGSTFINEEGSTQQVTKASVGGVVSEGILCDSRMLGWTGGAKGIAVQVPNCCDVGSSPPSTKPRPTDGTSNDDSTVPVAAAPGLYEKKLTKEEKKKIAEEKRKARKEAKQAKADAVNESS